MVLAARLPIAATTLTALVPAPGWGLHVAVAPFFVADSRATRVVGDGPLPWDRERRADLAEVRRLEDVVLLRYALSARFDPDGPGGAAA